MTILKLLLLASLSFADERLMNFDLANEGLYEIALSCSPNPQSCNSAVIKALDRASVIVRNAHEVWVNFSSHKEGYSIDSFPEITPGQDPHALSGVAHSVDQDSRFSYFDMKFDPERRELSGQMLDARNPGTYFFTGHALRSIEILSEPPATLHITEAQIAGSYSGKVGAFSGRLNLRERPDHMLIGSYTSYSASGDPLFTLDFNNGSFDAQKGIVRLIYANPNFLALGEMAFRVKAVSRDGRPSFDGFLQSTFTDQNLSWERIN